MDVSNGIEALRLLGRDWYVLIVSNLRMPELDGPSLLLRRDAAVARSAAPLLFLAGPGGTSDYDGFLKVIIPCCQSPSRSGRCAGSSAGAVDARRTEVHR